MQNTATRMPSRLEWASLAFLVVLVIVFGGLVELRSAFLSRRMGDLTCYLRPAWGALAGENIYNLDDGNGWHYNYPPLYAILLIPLADPPPGHDTSALVPYPVSVAIVYSVNMLCLVLAVHLLASALQRHSADPNFRDQPRYCRRWWALRVWPTLICLTAIGHSAMRGQVNLQILLLFCAWMSCLVGERRRLGGFFLAIAIAIKVIPIYLLVYPLWRRDGRALAGCGIGLFAGLVAVPLLAFGPVRTVDEYTRYGEVLFGPLLGIGTDKTRERELLGMDATDSMGIKHALHCWRYPDQYHRPLVYDAAEEWAHRVLGVLMTLAVLWPARRSTQCGPWHAAHQLGTLLLLMVIFSPISHVHYFTFCLPLVMSLLFRRWEHGSTLRVGWPLGLALTWFVLATGLPSLPELEVLKDMRVPLLGALPLWAFGVLDRWRTASTAQSAPAEPPQRAAA